MCMSTIRLKNTTQQDAVPKHLTRPILTTYPACVFTLTRDKQQEGHSSDVWGNLYTTSHSSITSLDHITIIDTHTHLDRCSF